MTLDDPSTFLRTTVGAGVFLEVEDHVLLVSPNYGGAKGGWILPGGMIEKGETPQEGAIRETLEETALDVEVIEPLVARMRAEEFGEPNFYWIFRAHAQGSLAELRSKISFPKKELLDVQFVSVSEARDGEDARGITRKLLQMLAGQSTEHTEPISWYNDGHDCLYRFF